MKRNLRLGEEWLRAGNSAEAERCFLKVLEREPGHPRALQVVGLLAHRRGERRRAVEVLAAAVRAAPEVAELHSHLAEARRAAGDAAGAVEAAREAARLAPDAAQVQNNLGLALQAAGRTDEAAAAFREAIAFAPRYPKAHFNLGNLLAAGDRPAEALFCYDRALSARPDYRKALVARATLLIRLERHREAAETLRSLLRFTPRDLRAHLLLGQAEFARFDFAAAAAAYRRALEIDPEHAQARGNLELSRAEICDWEGRPASFVAVRALVRRELEAGRDSPVSPHGALFFPFSPAERLAIARRRAELVARRVEPLARQLALSHPEEAAGSRLRLGYLSSDFRDNALAHLTAGLYQLHDRERFEVFGYSLGPDDGSDYRRRIAAGCDRFVDLREATDVEAARRIHDDGIHVLVDLVGFAGGARPEILALRPAPVQAVWLYPGSMGGVFHDVLIGDPVATPPETRGEYGERLVLLPHSYQVNDHDQPLPHELRARAHAGLPERGFVYCSFNTHAKIEPGVFDVWTRLLAAEAGSVLWLLELHPEGRRNLRQEAERRGVDPGRLVFASHVPRPRHLARLALADLALDTRVCSGHTTTSDCLWAGVPVVTCPGDTFPSRVSASLLRAVGHPELVTRDLEEYEALARRLTRDPERRQQIRTDLRSGRLRKPLFDTPRFVRNLEQAFGAMWERRHSGDGSPIVLEEVAR